MTSAGDLNDSDELHSESKNRATIHLFITSTNVGRFSKFFHCCILPDIYNKTHATLPTTP